ncbi:MAG: energy-coupling factor transporter transmembrane component T [Candidatus Bathyarchaeia archaeon]
MLSYRYIDTPIHRLHPWPKVVWLSGLIILSLIFDHPIYILLMFLSTLPVVVIAKVTSRWLYFMRTAFLLCLFIVAINALFSGSGTNIVYSSPLNLPLIGRLTVTLEGIIFGVGMSLRLFAIISAFAILNLIINPDDLLLQAAKLKAPYKIVLATSLATRFFPTLLKDAETIMDAQRSRGIELDRGHFLRKIRNAAPIFIALLSSSLERSIQVAESMEARAFGSKNKRSTYRKIDMSRTDRALVALAVSPLILGTVMRLLNYGEYSYYPSVEEVILDGAAPLLMFTLLSLPIATTVLLPPNKEVKG